MRRREYQHIGFLIFGLAVVLALIFYMQSFQKGVSLLPEQGPPIPKDARVEVVGRFYYNTLQGFSLRVPTTEWRIKAVTETDSIPSENVGKTVFDNAVPMVEITRIAEADTVALIEVGLVKQTIVRNARDFAIQALGEIIEEYEVSGQKVTLTKEVTVPAHSTLEGAYFMIVLPKSSGERFPVWIFTSIVKGGYAYVISARVGKENYTEVRQDLEAIIRSFRFL